MKTQIDPATTIDAVTLTTADLARSVEFYTDNLGLQVRAREIGLAYLGAGGDDLLILSENPSAARYPRTAGLYHFAILLPTRVALANALRRLMETGVPLQGASDHLVSEAIYLADPDGNGIELYRDRPRSTWGFDGDSIRMASDPLDLRRLLAEAQVNGGPSLPQATIMGHIHLQAGDLQAAENFYRSVLGMQLMARFGRSASFLSAGGYHHHVAINTWAGTGLSAPPENAIGLREFVLKVPHVTELNRIAGNFAKCGIPFEQTANDLLVRDPAQNRVRLALATASQRRERAGRKECGPLLIRPPGHYESAD